MSDNRFRVGVDTATATNSVQTTSNQPQVQPTNNQPVPVGQSGTSVPTPATQAPVEQKHETAQTMPTEDIAKSTETKEKTEAEKQAEAQAKITEQRKTFLNELRSRVGATSNGKNNYGDLENIFVGLLNNAPELYSSQYSPLGEMENVFSSSYLPNLLRDPNTAAKALRESNSPLRLLYKLDNGEVVASDIVSIEAKNLRSSILKSVKQAKNEKEMMDIIANIFSENPNLSVEDKLYLFTEAETARLKKIVKEDGEYGQIQRGLDYIFSGICVAPKYQSLAAWFGGCRGDASSQTQNIIGGVLGEITPELSSLMSEENTEIAQGTVKLPEKRKNLTDEIMFAEVTSNWQNFADFNDSMDAAMETIDDNLGGDETIEDCVLSTVKERCDKFIKSNDSKDLKKARAFIQNIIHGPLEAVDRCYILNRVLERLQEANPKAKYTWSSLFENDNFRAEVANMIFESTDGACEIEDEHKTMALGEVQDDGSHSLQELNTESSANSTQQVANTFQKTNTTQDSKPKLATEGVFGWQNASPGVGLSTPYSNSYFGSGTMYQGYDSFPFDTSHRYTHFGQNSIARSMFRKVQLNSMACLNPSFSRSLVRPALQRAATNYKSMQQGQ